MIHVLFSGSLPRVSRMFVSKIPRLALGVCLRRGWAVLPSSQFLPRAKREAPVRSPVSAVSPQVTLSAKPGMNGCHPDPELVFTLRGWRNTWVMRRCSSNARTSLKCRAEWWDGATWCHTHLLLCAGQAGSQVTSWGSCSLRIIASVRHRSFLQTVKLETGMSLRPSLTAEIR